jgi:hypothetical protein
MEKYIKPISQNIKLNQIQLLNVVSVPYKGDYDGSTVIIGAKRNGNSSEWDEEEEDYEEEDSII